MSINATKDEKQPLLAQKREEHQVASAKSIINEGEEQDEQPQYYSKNVPRIMSYQLVDGICFSIWQATVLQVLLYRLGGNSFVGWVSGVAGAAQVLAAIVGSYAADKTNRAILVRCGAFSGFTAAWVSILATYYEAMPLFWMSSVNWGFYMGMSNPAVEALFGDSVATGKRAKIYTYKWMIQIVSYVFGYLMNLVMFLKMGNHWTTPEIKTVLYCGLGLHFVSFAMLLTADDKHVLPPVKGKKKDGEEEKEKKQTKKKEGDEEEKTEKEGDEEEEEEEKSAADVTAGDKYAAAHPEEALENDQKKCMKWSHVPYFISGGDFLLALGSGMTLRYLPLFFINSYDVGPVLLSAVLIAISLTTTLVAYLIRPVGEKYLGRVLTIFIVRSVGTSGLAYLALASGRAASLAPMLVCWVLRNSLMNSTLGMSRSVIMDFVPKSQRARWSAFESFSGFTWAGSAVLGGYIADAHGYKSTFLVTVALHFTAALMIIPAIVISHKVERWIIEQNKIEAAAKKEKEEQGDA